MNKKEPFVLLFAAIIIISTAMAMAIKEKDIKHEIRVAENSVSSEFYTTVTTSKPDVGTTSATETSSETTSEAGTTSLTTTAPAESEKIYININTAGADELMKLKGIGPVLSEAIIAYRQQNGNFNNIEEIMLVSGIGEGKFEDIREHIFVENPVYPQYDEPENETGAEEETEAETETENYTEPTENTTEPYKVKLEDIAPININTATADELILLPHVTNEVAERIIWLREAIGGFSHVYELLYVEELEQSEVAEIVDYVTVEQ